MRFISFLLSLLLLCFLVTGCAPAAEQAQIAATTLPVYYLTTQLCQNTPLSTTRLVTESVSCLHDYTLQVSQMRAIEAAEVIVISGAGLEDFLEDALDGNENIIDASSNIELISCEQEHDHGHESEHHHHEQDPHIWLAPANMKRMAQTICSGLSVKYPDFTSVFEWNLSVLEQDLDALEAYAQTSLADLSCRELITFHDGFSYLAQAYDLTILEAVEEESGSEASAGELIELIELVREHDLPAIFIESNGSTAAASIIAAETGVSVYTLDMAMSGDDYLEAMYHNIDTLKEALG